MPRTRPSLPTKSLQNNMVRGKRTGRRIHATRVATNEDGLQNMEAFFDAQTIEEVTEDAKPPAAKKKKRIRTPQTPKPKTPKASVRLSVGNDNEDNDDEDDDDEDDMKDYQAAALTQKYITKLKTSITSPSELSKVSTAPPTPHEREATRFAANDDDEKSDDDDDDALLTQEKEELVVPQSAAETAGAKPQLLDRVESPEPAFPPMDLEDVGIKAHSDDEDFDMGPPDQDDDDDDDDDVPAPETEPEDKKPKASSKMESDTEDDDDKEDDKEGTNFHMVHDPETPASVRQKRADEEKAALERKRGRTKKKRSDSDDDDEEEIQTPVRKIKKKKKRHVAFSPQGVPIANRSYKAVPVADLVEESPGEDGPRRSRRAKCKPLDYWKNEKFEYGAHHETGVLGEAMGDMPIVVNVVKAMPTPYKKRQVTKNSSSKEQNGHNAVKRPAVEDNQEPFDTKRLRKKYKVVDGEIAHIWDDTADDSADLKVVSYYGNMEGSSLPPSSSRTKQDGKVVGKAAQAFNIPNDDSDNYAGYIMGNLRLPPKGIKDAESVGPCSQTFTVCECQPKALEVAYGDPDLPEGTLNAETAQRFYMSPGDLFRVPPGNCYRLQNHSKTTNVLLTWTIIRPRNLATSS